METAHPSPSELKVRAAASCAALLMSSVAVAGLESSAPADVNLAGTWTLNVELSDDPQKVLEEKRTQMKERMGGMRPTRGANAGGLGGSMRMGERSNPEALRQQMEQRLATAERIEIQQGTAAMTFTTDAGTTTCETTEKTQVSTPEGGVADRRCGWDGEGFVIELESSKGFTQRDSYQLSEDGKQLMVTTELQGRMPGGGVTIKRVYDRADAS